MYDEIIEIVVRVLTWLVALSLAAFWIVGLLRLVLPQLNLAIMTFAATPGGLVVIALTWRALGRRARRR